MGFFAEFNLWLNGLLTGYIGDNTARIAGAVEPAVVTLAVIYVMVWGYLQLTGQIEEPFIGGLKKILTLAVVLGCALQLWLYNSVLVDTFFNGPSQLAAVIIGAFDPVSIIDQILFDGGDTANLLLQKGGLLDGNFAYYLAGIGVYLIVGLTAVYTIFLLALSRIALSVLLALGPLFLGLLLFASTKRFFEAWLAQLANYALVTILTVLVAALMLHVVTVAAQQAVSSGGAIQIASAARMHGGRTYVPRHAPGHAHGGRTCHRAGLEQLRRCQCRDCLGVRWCGARRSPIYPGPGRSHGQSLGSAHAPGRLRDAPGRRTRHAGPLADQSHSKECLNVKRECLSLCVAVLALILGGCTSYPKRVDCEGHLRAINAPESAAPKGSAP